MISPPIPSPKSTSHSVSKSIGNLENGVAPYSFPATLEGESHFDDFLRMLVHQIEGLGGARIREGVGQKAFNL